MEIIKECVIILQVVGIVEIVIIALIVEHKTLLEQQQVEQLNQHDRPMDEQDELHEC